MSHKIIKSTLLMAVCLLLQGCGRLQIREQEENDWSFQADGVEDDTQHDCAESEIYGKGTVQVEDSEAYNEDTVPAADAGSREDEKQPEGYVYLCGAVEHPGVYEIHEGMRIFEVLEMAGGMTDEADPDWVNQAQPVCDGQMLQIYTKEETDQMRNSRPAAGDTGVQAEDAAASDGKVNINTAGRDELMTLSGIGEAKADAILQYRQEHGAFGSIEEICRISGIKEAVFSNIKDRITI